MSLPPVSHRIPFGSCCLPPPSIRFPPASHPPLRGTHHSFSHPHPEVTLSRPQLAPRTGHPARSGQALLAAAVVQARARLLAEAGTPAAEAARETFHAAAWALALSEERLAWAMARKVRGVGDTPLEDLAQLGLEGLFVAACRFDPGRGVHFSTMARWWVRAVMTREAHRDRLVRLPQPMMDLSMRARQMPEGLSEQEEAAWLGVSLRRLREWRSWCSDPFLVLDEQTGDADSETIGGRFVSDDPAPEEVLIEDLVDSERHRQAEAALMELSPRHAEIVRRHLGLDGVDPLPLAALAREMGLSRERARQLWGEALDTLQLHASARLRVGS